MSDRISRVLAGYAAAATPGRLPAETSHEVKRRVLDSIGVAIAGRDEPASRAARAYAATTEHPGGSRVWSTPAVVATEAAAFANGVAVRCLDFNDTYLSKEPLHPSDAIAPLVALAERHGRPAAELLCAIAVAYEVGVALCDAVGLRRHGWDHVNVTGIAVACGAGRLRGLPADRIEHAIAIAAVPHAAMRQTRIGELSMWKGAAAANAGRNALFAVEVAAEGMTGPAEPFLGEAGLARQLLDDEPIDEGPLEPLANGQPPRAILRTHVKAWPVEYHAQSAVDAALGVLAELGGDPRRLVAHVRVDTFATAYEIIAKDREKWDPRTRETADHSLPYVTLAALLDGEVTASTFEPERFREPATLELLGRAVSVHEDRELSAGYPDGTPNRVTVTTTDGRTIAREVRYPRGHARNPMSDEELTEKYRGNVGHEWKPERAERVARLVWDLEEPGSFDALLAELGDRP